MQHLLLLEIKMAEILTFKCTSRENGNEIMAQIYLLVIKEEAFDKLRLANGRVAAKNQFQVAALHFLRLTDSLVENFLVVVSS